jgi:hypothetical protein
VADDAKLKLTFRLVPADDRPADPVVLDDIVRLIRQAAATAPKDVPKVTEPADGFRAPADDEGRDVRGLESRIENRVQQASAASQGLVERRALTASQLDGQQMLAEQSLEAAERVIAAVQGALFRAVAVRVAATDG